MDKYHLVLCNQNVYRKADKKRNSNYIQDQMNPYSCILAVLKSLLPLLSQRAHLLEVIDPKKQCQSLKTAFLVIIPYSKLKSEHNFLKRISFLRNLPHD